MSARLAVPLLISLLAAASSAQQKPAFPPLAVPDTLGVNIHFTSPRPGEMEMLAAGGFTWVRMDFTWGGTERKKGEYNFEAYDKLMASLEPHKIRALFILDYANKLYDNGLSPHTDEGRVAMAKWAAAAVKHFAGKGIIWEMWNEPNIVQFWKPKPSVGDYARLSNEVGKAIRAAAPGEIYVGAATSTIDLPFLEACFKAGCLDYWDAVTVHPYRQKDPETATEEYRKLRLMIVRYAPKGKSIPIISGEWGYSAAWGKFEADRQGKYLPREFLVNLYNEVPLSIWYDWHDDGKDPKEAEHNFGTVKNPYLKDQSPVYEPKSAYLAVQTLSRQLGGFAYNKRLSLGDDQDWVLLFTRGNDVRLAAWTTSKTPRKVVIPASPGKFTVTNHLGDKTTAVDADGAGLSIELGDTVQYLVPEKPNDLLRVGAAWQRLPLEVAIRAPEVAFLGSRAANPLERPLRMGPGPDNLSVYPPAGAAVKSAEPRGPAGAAVSLVPVTRADTTRRVEETLIVESLGTLRQSTVVAVTNPISITLLPPAANQLPILVDNPSGEAFTGHIELAQPRGIQVSQPLVKAKIEQGQTQKVVTLPITSAEPAFSTGLKVTDTTKYAQAGHLPPEATFTVSPVSLEPRDFFGQPDGSELAKNLKIYVDGDKKVLSQQSMAIAAPPQPPPVGAVPCLKVDYDFAVGWKFIRVAPAQELRKNIPANAKKLGMWVYGDAQQSTLRIRYIDSAGTCFQPDGHRVSWTGWKWVTFPLDGTSAGHWGKSDDGTVRSPIRLDTLILIDGHHQQKIKGELYFTGATYIE